MKRFGVRTLAVAIAVVTGVFGCDRGDEDALAEAKLLTLTANLQSIRAQLELYKIHHNEKYPTHIKIQLTGKTDTDGTVNASGAYGLYLQVFPANPFVDDPVEAVKTGGGPGEGWSYGPATGAFVANTPGHEQL